MRATKDMVEMSIKIIITYVVQSLSEDREISKEDAFRLFAQSKTFALLRSGKAKLYTESPESVLAMFESEEIGDTDGWFNI